MTSLIIDESIIDRQLSDGAKITEAEIACLIERMEAGGQPSIEEIAQLLFCESELFWIRIFRLAEARKQEIYGNRIVLFAPLYVSNHCVNNCTYCGYRRDNLMPRRRLTQPQIRTEVEQLLGMGHKRLAFEVGEDPVNCNIEYVEESLRTIYAVNYKGISIRRINVNIAATTVENYRRLKTVGIGTYILFQETYRREVYDRVHPQSLKSDYDYHLGAFSRAMEAGIDDVGAGVLFGLTDWRFELIALLHHNAYLETSYGVGFHTVSVPRIKPADGVSLEQFPHLIDDSTFFRIVALLRLALPFVGIIVSTRESVELRRTVVRLGVSQLSAGSKTGVGSYSQSEESLYTEQFQVEDNRSPLEVLRALLDEGYLPSYCTACYRTGRTGDRFMALAKSGNIRKVCLPNALMTLMEYAMDYGDDEVRSLVWERCLREIEQIPDPKVARYTEESLRRIEQGERDLFL